MCIRVPEQVAAQGVLVMAGGHGSNGSYNGSSMLLNDVWVSLSCSSIRKKSYGKQTAVSFLPPSSPSTVLPFLLSPSPSSGMEIGDPQAILHAPWDVDQMSSDGVTWTLVTAAAGWSKRCACCSVRM
jgi:hypothetical protein